MSKLKNEFKQPTNPILAGMLNLHSHTNSSGILDAIYCLTDAIYIS